MAENYATRFQAVEIHFPPQEVDPKTIVREMNAVILECRAALQRAEGKAA